MHTERDGALARWIEESIEFQTGDVFVLYAVVVIGVLTLAAGVFRQAKARDKAVRRGQNEHAIHAGEETNNAKR